MLTDQRRAEELRVRYLTEAVETATPAVRLTMIFDALELDLARVDQGFADGGHDLKVISDGLIHAQEILLTLRDTLDLEAWDGALRLAALYDYLHAELIMANINKDREQVRAVASHVSQLADAWRQAASRIETEPAS